MKSLLRRLSKSLLQRKKRRQPRDPTTASDAAATSYCERTSAAEISTSDGRHSVAILPSATSSLSDCETDCSSGYGSASTLHSEGLEEEEEEGEGEFGTGSHLLEDEVFEEVDSWSQWNIAASELALDKCVFSSPAEAVYSGYWHGSVSVHARLSSTGNALRSVLSDINHLTHIRHENIQLFLGVCYDLRSNCISIVMDQQKGDSLNTLVHKRGQQFGFHSITKILSQISQGMGYLHAKNIPHPLLTSRAVHIHRQQVTVSMLTPSGASTGFVDSCEVSCLPPEVARNVAQTEQPTVFTISPGELSTFKANVFSFGTLLYEMLHMKRPFASVPASRALQELARGHTASLSELPSGKLKHVVRNCWKLKAEERPSFKELSTTVEQNMSPRSCGLRSQFSFSDPSQIMKLGL